VLCGCASQDIAVEQNTGSAAAGSAVTVSADRQTSSEPFVPAESLELSCESTTYHVSIGHQVLITPTVSPSNATDPQLTFTSSDPSVATVDENGFVTGVSMGEVDITVSTGDGSEIVETMHLTVRLSWPSSVRTRSLSDRDAAVELTWDPVEDAVGYLVYRETEDGWERLSEDVCKRERYVDNDPLTEKRNIYAVVSLAEDDKYNSKKIACANLILPTTPYGTKIASVTDEGIQFYWKKPSDADGYEVYRSYQEDGAYTMLTDIPERTTYTYLDNQFNHKKRRVYYKIRSYQLTENGDKIYSPYSEPVEAAYREKLKLHTKKIFMRSASSRTLDAYIGWGDADSLVWSSSDESVASVSISGTIYASKQGVCEISCYSKLSDETKTCTVVVDREPMEPLRAIVSDYAQDENGVWSNPKAKKDNDAVIMMVGDMMCTGTQQAMQGYETGNYNFNESYDGVKSLIQSADLAVGNLETVLSSAWPYMHEESYVQNMANCNAPSRYLDAVRYAGFDSVMMANNHNCDAGKQGTQDTIEQVDRYKLARTGVFDQDGDSRYLLMDVDGIKVGYLSYLAEETGFNGKDETWNDEDVNSILNYFEKDKAEEDIKQLRKAGAEYVIVYMHWGVKNMSDVRPAQKEDAQELADIGADYIVGSHCHLIQPYTEITAADGRKVPCFYSLGDFQSSIDQIEGNRDSAILRIRLTRDESGAVVLAENGYIPCYTETEYQGKYFYTIPIDPSLNGGVELEDYDRMHERITEAVGDQIREYTGS
jgi:poly-gamma-glutamate capsule biosynthesis protein CapA/YwtB (metallophosphatase superfamily)